MQSNSFFLRVIVAENGHVFKIPVNPYVTIESIKNSLVQHTTLNPSEQILIADKTLTSKTLEHYGITSDRDIYLFNKRIILDPSLKPDAPDLSINEFKRVPKKPIPNNLEQFENSTDPLQRLYATEYYLSSQLGAAKFLKDEIQNKIIICNNMPNNISHQKSAIKVANVSFFEYRENLFKHANIFFREFDKKKPYFELVFSSFESDISKLKQTKLHESL
ncbi:hypothetical protein DICPUDRAFT_91291, partial [Dictyostelium purpureum]